MKKLTEICGNCGCTKGSHSSGTKPWPLNTCPATEEGIDFAQGPGTTFKSTNTFKEINHES